MSLEDPLKQVSLFNLRLSGSRLGCWRQTHFMADIWLASSYSSAWNGSPLWSSLYWHYGPFNIHLHVLGESE